MVENVFVSCTHIFWGFALLQKIVQAQFIDTAQLEQLVKATERVFSNVFYDGDVRHGAMELKLKRSDHTTK